MDKILKLLRKISKPDRERLLKIINKLFCKEKRDLNIKKVKNTEFYRLRLGRFRVIFHYEGARKEIIIDSIRLRQENTYK
ncbi:MAG: hypothetical protein Q8O88_06215 [bacterium]|nr:hypothetical protein [bacterium]